MRELIKGGNAPVSGSVPSVAVRWCTGDRRIGAIDVSAFLLRAGGKVAGDRDMVFYGQRESGGGAVRVERLAARIGPRSESVFVVGLRELPPDVERIAFTGTIHEAAGKGLSFSQVETVEIAVTDGGADSIRFLVPTAGATETALILGELYRRDGAWKFRAVGQGFDGGLGPLARSFGVDVADAAPTAPVPPPSPVLPPTPAASPVSLSKVTLDKARPTIDLAKKPDGFGEIRVNLNWSREQSGGGFFGRRPKAVDLDVGCLFELRDGSKGTVQALGGAFGAFDEEPYIELSGDDRTGSVADGEWIRINGRRWGEIGRVLLYAFIYEGVPNWAATDGVATVYVPGSAPIEVRLEEGGRLGMCAIASIENAGGEMRISRQVSYFKGHRDMDKAFRWGLRWAAGSKS